MGSLEGLRLHAIMPHKNIQRNNLFLQNFHYTSMLFIFFIIANPYS